MYTKLADSNIDEGQKLARLKTTIPTETYNYITIAARNRKQYEGPVQLVEAQLLDPLTGPARGDTQPCFSGPNGDNGNANWTSDQVENGFCAL